VFTTLIFAKLEVFAIFAAEEGSVSAGKLPHCCFILQYKKESISTTFFACDFRTKVLFSA